MGRLVPTMQRMQQALASSVSKVRNASIQIDVQCTEESASIAGTADLDGENERRKLRTGQSSGAGVALPWWPVRCAFGAAPTRRRRSRG